MITTHQDFEDVFRARREAYVCRRDALVAELHALKEDYHRENAELERQRAAALHSPKNRIRKECFRLQHVLGGVFAEWRGKETDVLDVQHAVSKFDCTGEDAAVFTITVPYVGAEERKEACAYDGE